MSVNEHLVLLVAMAVAVTAILTVGTLLAADIIHLGRRTPPRATPDASGPDDPGPAEDAVDALAPLGSALDAGSRLRSPR